MDEKKFKGIIQFAIDKEINSASFYTSASRVAKHSGAKELFLDLTKEEEGHRKLLENLNEEKITQARIENIPDLKISDYMMEVAFRPDMPYADILRMGMKMEEHSLNLYNHLKESSNDADLEKLFAFLAQEEAKHKLKFEKLYDEEILK